MADLKAFAEQLVNLTVKEVNELATILKEEYGIEPAAAAVAVAAGPAAGGAAAAEEKTVGGIIIPDSAKEKPLKGEVKAVGQGTKDEEMVVKEGDTVLYGKYAGTEIEFEGEKYLIMRQSDILAII